MIPLVSRMFGHLPGYLTRHALPSLFKVPSTPTPEDRPWKDMRKLLLLKALVPNLLVLGKVSHLLGPQIHVSPVNLS